MKQPEKSGDKRSASTPMESEAFEIIILPPPPSILTLSSTIPTADMHSLLQPYLSRRKHQIEKGPELSEIKNFSEYMLHTFGIQMYMFPGVKLANDGSLAEVLLGKEDTLTPEDPCTLEFVRNVAIGGKIFVCPIGQKEEKKWHGIARAAAMDRIMGINNSQNKSAERVRFQVCLKGNTFKEQECLITSHVVPATTKPLKSQKKTKAASRKRPAPSPKTSVIVSPPPSTVVTRYTPSTNSHVSLSSSEDGARRGLCDTPSYISLTTDMIKAPVWKGRMTKRIGKPYSEALSLDEFEKSIDRIQDELPIEKLYIKPPRTQIAESPVHGMRAAYFDERAKVRQWDGLFTASEIEKKLNDAEFCSTKSEWVMKVSSDRALLRDKWISGPNRVSVHKSAHCLSGDENSQSCKSLNPLMSF